MDPELIDKELQGKHKWTRQDWELARNILESPEADKLSASELQGLQGGLLSFEPKLQAAEARVKSRVQLPKSHMLPGAGIAGAKYFEEPSIDEVKTRLSDPSFAQSIGYEIDEGEADEGLDVTQRARDAIWGEHLADAEQNGYSLMRVGAMPEGATKLAIEYLAIPGRKLIQGFDRGAFGGIASAAYNSLTGSPALAQERLGLPQAPGGDAFADYRPEGYVPDGSEGANPLSLEGAAEFMGAAMSPLGRLGRLAGPSTGRFAGDVGRSAVAGAVTGAADEGLRMAGEAAAGLSPQDPLQRIALGAGLGGAMQGTTGAIGSRATANVQNVRSPLGPLGEVGSANLRRAEQSGAKTSFTEGLDPGEALRRKIESNAQPRKTVDVEAERLAPQVRDEALATVQSRKDAFTAAKRQYLDEADRLPIDDLPDPAPLRDAMAQVIEKLSPDGRDLPVAGEGVKRFRTALNRMYNGALVDAADAAADAERNGGIVLDPKEWERFLDATDRRKLSASPGKKLEGGYVPLTRERQLVDAPRPEYKVILTPKKLRASELDTVLGEVDALSKWESTPKPLQAHYQRLAAGARELQSQFPAGKSWGERGAPIEIDVVDAQGNRGRKTVTGWRAAEARAGEEIQRTTGAQQRLGVTDDLDPRKLAETESVLTTKWARDDVRQAFDELIKNPGLRSEVEQLANLGAVDTLRSMSKLGGGATASSGGVNLFGLVPSPEARALRLDPLRRVLAGLSEAELPPRYREDIGALTKAMGPKTASFLRKIVKAPKAGQFTTEMGDMLMLIDAYRGLFGEKQRASAEGDTLETEEP